MADLALLRLMELLAARLDAASFETTRVDEVGELDLTSLRFEGSFGGDVLVSHDDVGTVNAKQLGEMVQAKKRREQANVDELMAPEGGKTLIEWGEADHDAEDA